MVQRIRFTRFLPKVFHNFGDCAHFIPTTISLLLLLLNNFITFHNLTYDHHDHCVTLAILITFGLQYLLGAFHIENYGVETEDLWLTKMVINTWSAVCLSPVLFTPRSIRSMIVTRFATDLGHGPRVKAFGAMESAWHGDNVTVMWR